MSYVRLDDSVMDNPKMLKLSDRAFRGWVWGLCFAQRHLTDGYIPLDALTGPVKRAAGELQSRGLWTVADHGFQIHDYLKHQDSKETVEKRKANARDRIADRRKEERCSPERTPNVRTNISETFAAPSLPLPSLVSSGSDRERESEGKPAPILRSHRNCMGLCSERICLMQRQFEDFVGRLGGEKATAELRVKRWAEDVLLAWNEGAHRDSVIQGDTFKWWNVRYEEWQGSPKAATGAPKLATPIAWSCTAHNPPCAIQWRCQQLIDIATEKARAAV